MPHLIVENLSPSRFYKGDALYFGSDIVTSGAYASIQRNQTIARLDIVLPTRGLYLNGDIATTEDTSSGVLRVSSVVNDYTTLTAGQDYKAAYFRYNVRSTTPGNPVVTVVGVHGAVASYVADEAMTMRGGYFTTYVNADATSTMRTNIGCEMSARASYAGGTECVAENGTCFTGARIWMAPYFTSGSIGNVNNFWGLWIYGEHATQRNADAAIFINDIGGGFTDGIRIGATLTGYAIRLDVDDAGISVGASQDAVITWDTTHTQDALVVGLGASRALVLMDKADVGTGATTDVFDTVLSSPGIVFCPATPVAGHYAFIRTYDTVNITYMVFKGSNNYAGFIYQPENDSDESNYMQRLMGDGGEVNWYRDSKPILWGSDTNEGGIYLGKQTVLDGLPDNKFFIPETAYGSQVLGLLNNDGTHWVHLYVSTSGVLTVVNEAGQTGTVTMA